MDKKLETTELVKTKLVSSNLEEMHYDKKSEILTVFFKNQTAYKYSHVPEKVHAQFVAAESKGQFFHKFIRSNYKCEKVLIPTEPKGQP